MGPIRACRKTILFFLTAVAVHASAGGAGAAELVREFRYPADRLVMRWRGDTVSVTMRGALAEVRPGRPDLPVVCERLDLPPGTRVRSVSALDEEMRPVAAHARVLRVQDASPGFGGLRPLPADPLHGAPEQTVSLGTQGSMRGRNLAWLLVRPVRWDPVGGGLERVERLRVRVEIEAAPDEDVVRRERIVGEWESDAPAPSKAVITSATPGGSAAQPFKASQLPSVLGSPVAYVIVTTDALAAEFQRLADWKTQSGVPAVVRTVSFIRAQYPDGVDDADRIRRFLRDAYARWGTAWVLLGGDVGQVPARIAYSTLCYDDNCTPPPMNDIVSDLYYSCLDGNWNADGDTYFGEGISSTSGDKCDLLPEVWVGRAPVSTVAEVTRFVDRTFQYERTPVGDYENQMLFFSQVLFPKPWTPGQPIVFDGAEMSEICLPHVQTNPALRYARLYQNYLDPRWQPGALPETRARVIDSLDVGYNVAVHVGHGYRNVASCGDANFSNADALALTNGNRLMNTYMANCTSNAIDYPCLGEALLNAPGGGSVTNVGSTRVDFPNVGEYFQNEYFRLVYEDHVTAVGEAQARQKLPFVPYAVGDNTYRWTIQTLLLLGDPELRIWTSRPRTLAVTHAASIAADATTLTVGVQAGGLPLAGARVTAYKANDEYRIGTTDAAGQVALDFRPDGTGSFILTVTAYDCRPYQATVPITAAGSPVLAQQAPVVDDDAIGGTNGNGNLAIEAGETVDLRVPLRNNGGTTAAAVSGTLSTTDPLVSVIAAANAYGSIAPGAVANGTGWFRISTTLAAADQREIPFTLAATDGAARTHVETFQVTLGAPELRHVSHTVTELIGNGNGRPEAGETVDYAVRLRNLGTGAARGVTAVLANYDGLATIIDGAATFGDIAPGGEVQNDAFRFSLTGAAVLELRISTAYGLLSTQRVDLGWPVSPAGLVAAPAAGSIELRWSVNPEADLAGYLVYRATSAAGPFVQVPPVPTDRSAYDVDGSLPGLTRYYYKVAAADSSGNISPQTAVVSATTNPPYHPPFPIQMGPTASNTQSSVAVARIHQAGKMDILAGADVLYDWNSDGTAPVDADLLPATVGDFTTQGKYYAGGPSVADLDGGGLEIVGATWNTKKVFAFDTQGQVKAGWPFTAAYEIFSCPALWDLDSDGTKEVIFGSNGPYLYALRSNGTEWMDGDANAATPGVFKILGASYNFGTPAIADLDGNGQPDIVYGGSDGNLYAWRPTGASLPGFPITLGGSVFGSVAIGYLDGATDTQLDIVVAAGNGADSLYVFLANGGRRPGFPVPVVNGGGYAKSPSPALADIDRDGYLDIVAAGSDGRLVVYNRNGVLFPAFASVRYSALIYAATESSPVVADITGDGAPDIVIGDDNGVLSGFGADGLPLPGFPIRIPAEVKGAPALCDCDGDGLSEIVLAGWDARLYVWDFDMPFSPGVTPPWPQFHHDAMRTGFASAQTVLDTPMVVPPLALRLVAPVPNPASLRVRLGYEIPAGLAGQPLAVDVFDIAGRHVRRLAAGTAGAGRFPAEWDLRGAGAGRVGPGVYLLRLRVGAATQSRRMVVLP